MNISVGELSFLLLETGGVEEFLEGMKFARLVLLGYQISFLIHDGISNF